MPDIISKIRLEASGADNVAREINKIRQAYDDTADAAADVQGAKVGVAGADPFERAIQSGQESPAIRQERTRAEREAYNQRLHEHYRPTGDGDGRAPGDMLTSARAAQGVAGAARGGDVLGAAAGTKGLLSGLGVMGGGLLGIAGILLGAIGMGVKKEFEMIKQLYAPGTTRRLGETYGTLRDLQIGLATRVPGEGESVVPIDELNALFSSLGAAGGKIKTQGAGFGVMAERMARYGISPDVMGQFMATTGRAGYAGTGESNTQLLANVFGVGRTGQGLQQIGAILEAAMFRGARKGSLVLEQGAGRIAREAAGLSVFGGLSMESAFQTVQQMEESTVRGARPQTPLNVMTLRRVMAQNPGMSLFEAQAWVGRNPLAARNVQAGLLRQQYGGDRNRIGRAIMREGFEPWQAMSIIEMYENMPEGGVVTQEMWDEAAAGERGKADPRRVLGERGAYGAAILPDIEMNKMTRLLQLQMFHKVGDTFIKSITAVMEWLESFNIDPEALRTIQESVEKTMVPTGKTETVPGVGKVQAYVTPSEAKAGMDFEGMSAAERLTAIEAMNELERQRDELGREIQFLRRGGVTVGEQLKMDELLEELKKINTSLITIKDDMEEGQ